LIVWLSGLQSTVAELRADLVAKTGIPVDHQRLIFFGRVISAEQDAKQLGELGKRNCACVTT
jgi:hypothetical protein